MLKAFANAGIICACAAAVFIARTPTAHAQQTPPAIWTGELGTAPIEGADREYGGERAIGDVLAENSWSYRRTARLASAYEADVQGIHLSLPQGTPFVARFPPIAVAVAGRENLRRREAARGTLTWCALPDRGHAPCFFWDTEGGVYGHAAMTGGAPSTRAWLGDPAPAPMPDIVEQDVGLPPQATRVLLQDADADGYILQVITQEAGTAYTRSYPRQAWGAWHYVFLAPYQRIRAAPIVDSDGSVRGARVEFTREPPSQSH